MIIEYTPATGEARRWDLKQTAILIPEAAAVERACGERWPQVKAAAMEGGAQALWAIAWVLMKREQPTLRMTQWTPAADELAVDFDAEERALLRAEADKNPDLTDDQREQIKRELADPDPESGWGTLGEPSVTNAEAAEGEAPKDSAADSPTEPVNTAG